MQRKNIKEREKLMKNTLKKAITFVLALAMVLSCGTFANLASAKTKVKTPSLAKKSISLKVGEKQKLKIKNQPKGSKVTFTSKDKKVATVTKKGVVKAVAAGNTKVIVKVTYKNKGKKVKKTLKANVKVEAVTVAPTVAPTTKAAVTAAPTVNPVPTVAPFDDSKTAKELSANEMSPGINIGNYLEATLDKDARKTATKPSDFETAWGSKLVTKETIDSIAAYGFKTVRIPVGWSNMCDDKTYEINPLYMKRVQEIVDWVIEDGMYAIINIHWDSQWWGQFGSKSEAWRAEAWKRYKAFWTQIGENFKNHSDKLIFESANEELCGRLNDPIAADGYVPKTGEMGYRGNLTEDEQYETTNKINQTFVDIVRSQGGNNNKRYLLIAGFGTNIEDTCDDRYVMPTDTEENGVSKMFVSVHYYTPWDYCGDDTTTITWDRDSENHGIEEMRSHLGEMSKFTDAGYGVIIGEFGVCVPQHDNVVDYFTAMHEISAEYGLVPVLWDAQHMYFDRGNNLIRYRDVAEFYNNLTGGHGDTSAEAVSGPVDYDPDPMEVPDGLEPVFSWEGTWYKNDGSGAIGQYRNQAGNEGDFVITDSCTDGSMMDFNSWGYQAFPHINFKDYDNLYMYVTFLPASEQDDGTGEEPLTDEGVIGDMTLGSCIEVNGNSSDAAKIPFNDFFGKAVRIPKLAKSNGYIYLTFANAPIVTGIYFYNMPTK